MKSRLDDLPPYGRRDYEIPARYYNQVRLTQLRYQQAHRFALTGLRSLDVVLEDDAWICVDVSLNDCPILAWLDFAVARRENLSTPVRCTFCTYHAHAVVIVDRVLDQIAAYADHFLHHADTA